MGLMALIDDQTRFRLAEEVAQNSYVVKRTR
jgi:hypothetical protein